MPALGESVTEGTVTRWLKKEGETVEVDEPLLEVSTDKDGAGGTFANIRGQDSHFKTLGRGQRWQY